MWAEIAAEGRTEPGWHARRVFSGSPCDIRTAIRVPDGTIGVLFEVSSKSIPPSADLPDCVGFGVTVETIVPGPNGRVRLCLLLKEPRYKEVFSSLALDVCGAVAAKPSEAAGVRMLLSRLHTWERFIRRFGDGYLSDEAQLGLFAELHFLASEVLLHMEPMSAIQAWRGPYREPHDFRFRSAGVEIKASAARAPTSIKISNLDQLDLGSLDLLLVQHILFNVDVPSGRNLPSIIDQIRLHLVDDAAAASAFNEALVEAGYLDTHSDAYRHRYEVNRITWFNVAGDFPRLTRNTIPPGVAEAAYSIALQSCVSHTLEQSVATSMLHASL